MTTLDSRLDWRDRVCWIFDMDGTLTVPAHDFSAARRALGIDPQHDILEALARRSETERVQAEAWLDQWERDIAARAQPHADALDLVARLGAAGCRMGVLTRNTREVALQTLATIGLGDVFDPRVVLGRTCARQRILSLR